MDEVVIVGSGAAGVAAAMGCVDRGVRPLVLDVGIPPDSGRKPVEENLYEYRSRRGSFDLMIGDRFQGLAGVLSEREVPVKLTAPACEYVTRNAEIHSPLEERHFCAIQSFARGGLANAWGAGLYRFDERDLDGFPIAVSQLEAEFNRLTQEIGIGGEEDDLTPFFGPVDGLLPPLRLSRNMDRIYSRYVRMPYTRRTRDGFHLGRARLAVLGAGRDGRPGYRYRSLEFFQEDASIYSPRYTLDRLIREGKVGYESGLRVERYRETSRGIEITARPVDGDRSRLVEGRRLLLAAGAINSARIVLASRGDHETKLPLLENPALQIPLFLPTRLGRRLDREAFGLAQLNVIWDSPEFGARLQASVMELTAPSRAALFDSLPLPAHDGLAFLRHVLPAMVVAQLFFPSGSQPDAQLQLRSDGTLRITGFPNSLDRGNCSSLIRFFRRLGCLTLAPLIVRVPTGHAIHYAGTLPMRSRPAGLECHPTGRLAPSKGVYIADSATFPRLPAKNMSFAMMANAMRVAGIACESLNQ